MAPKPYKMIKVRPKKQLGQHFLRDENIAAKIVDSLDFSLNKVVEVGPGMGVLTKYLLQKPAIDLYLVEIDGESVEYLLNEFPEIATRIYREDFLKMDLNRLFAGKFSVIGNFPYNISSQIFFKILETRQQVSEVVCMVQKEVAERISSKHGNKSYGILSVLLQAFYNIEYLFTVHEHVFVPPPKVKSAVIRLQRNHTESLGCDEKLFVRIVKAAFNQRRKMLRNSLKDFGENLPPEMAEKRPEQLTVEDFVELTKKFSS